METSGLGIGIHSVFTFLKYFKRLQLMCIGNKIVKFNNLRTGVKKKIWILSYLRKTFYKSRINLSIICQWNEKISCSLIKIYRLYLFSLTILGMEVWILLFVRWYLKIHIFFIFKECIFSVIIIWERIITQTNMLMESVILDVRNELCSHIHAHLFSQRQQTHTTHG